jgi:aminoglycoside/choline kinase family phosphotransferase
MSIDDTRAKSIIHWLTQSLKQDIISFEPASSDASFRRYFRVTHPTGQYIVMDAPPDKENIKPFISIATLFKKSGINVPTIYQKNLAQGFLILEDFGSNCFLDQLTEKNALDLYLSAFNSLHTLQTRISASECHLPTYDKSLLSRELEIFYQWFLNQFLSVSIPDNIKNSLNQILISSALEQPQVCVHRDFHSRNLMVLTKNSPGIIDFQDALIGPITYDLVSLLRDCYITWPEQKILEWMTIYFQTLTDSGLINTDLKTFTRWFDFMGLQRHLKAIGIFSRLHLRDNKSSYLADIPRTMDYVSNICNHYPELTEFNQFLTHTVLPVFNNKK